jgi:hypothetical protein
MQLTKKTVASINDKNPEVAKGQLGKKRKRRTNWNQEGQSELTSLSLPSASLLQITCKRS